jgi:hypothetical protein
MIVVCQSPLADAAVTQLALNGCLPRLLCRNATSSGSAEGTGSWCAAMLVTSGMSNGGLLARECARMCSTLWLDVVAPAGDAHAPRRSGVLVQVRLALPALTAIMSAAMAPKPPPIACALLVLASGGAGHTIVFCSQRADARVQTEAQHIQANSTCSRSQRHSVSRSHQNGLSSGRSCVLLALMLIQVVWLRAGKQGVGC